jgi:hypothetical protein
MTRMRRGLLLLALTSCAVFAGAGSTAPAQATFGDTTSQSLGTVSTADVAAPSSIVGGLACGSSSATMSLTWQKSTSTRVSGYLIMVHFSDGYTQTVQKGPNDTSWSAPISLFNATAYSLRYSITTQTDYGWIKQSALTGSFQC